MEPYQIGKKKKIRKNRVFSIRRLRKTVNRLVCSVVPKKLQHKILRRLINLEEVLEEEIQFKVAENQDELEQALEIVHESYLSKRLIKAEDSQLRVTKYQCLPTTRVLVAKIGEDVVATMTVILDTPMGLPIETVTDIQAFRKQGLRIAEISSLGIKRSIVGR